MQNYLKKRTTVKSIRVKEPEKKQDITIQILIFQNILHTYKKKSPLKKSYTEQNTVHSCHFYNVHITHRLVSIQKLMFLEFSKVYKPTHVICWCYNMLLNQKRCIGGVCRMI